MENCPGGFDRKGRVLKYLVFDLEGIDRQCPSLTLALNQCVTSLMIETLNTKAFTSWTCALL